MGGSFAERISHEPRRPAKRAREAGPAPAFLTERHWVLNLRRSVDNQAVTRQLPADDSPPALPLLAQSPGRPLDPGTRELMEARLGHDFSRVRVHTDPKAAQAARHINATAFTVGHDVVLGANAPSPRSKNGRRLLAHELAHVVQQRADLPEPAEAGLDAEKEADAAATAITEGNEFAVQARMGVTLARQGPGGPAASPPARVVAGYKVSENPLPGGRIEIRVWGRVGDPITRPGLEKKYPLPSAIGLRNYDRFHLAGPDAVGAEEGIVYAPKNFNVSRTAKVENVMRNARAAVRTQGGEVYFDFRAVCRIAGDHQGVQIRMLESVTWKADVRPAGSERVLQVLNEGASVTPGPTPIVDTPAVPAGQPKGVSAVPTPPSAAAQEAPAPTLPQKATPPVPMPTTGGGGARPAPKTPAPAAPQPGRFAWVGVAVGSAALSLGIGLLSSYLKARVDRKIAAAQIDRNQAKAVQVINGQVDTILKMMMTNPEKTLYARVYMTSSVITTYEASGTLSEPTTSDSSPIIDLTGVGFTFDKLDPALADTFQGISGGGRHTTTVRLLISEIPLETLPIEVLIAFAKARKLPLDELHYYVLGRLAGVDQKEEPQKFIGDVSHWKHILDLVRSCGGATLNAAVDFDNPSEWMHERADGTRFRQEPTEADGVEAEWRLFRRAAWRSCRPSRRCSGARAVRHGPRGRLALRLWIHAVSPRAPSSSLATKLVDSGRVASGARPQLSRLR